MIKNKIQYQVTDKKRAEFKAALAELKEKRDINAILKEIQISALIAQIAIFDYEIEEYNNLKQQAGMATQP